MVSLRMEPFFVAFASMVFSAVLFSAKAVGPFDVTSYGAVGDGTKDDSEAFLKAWNDACKSGSDDPTMIIPNDKTFLVQALDFVGPCNTSKVSIKIEGGIKAPGDPKEWKKSEGLMPWIAFNGVKGLSVEGSGLIDGQGKGWWDIHCRDHPGPGCIMLAPTVMSFLGCSNVEVSHTHIKDSPQTHILVMGSQNVSISNVNLSSPGDTPNTDGIHLHNSRYISIFNSTIASGDDCISMGDPLSYVNISEIACGPGHGVSIGSLGKNGADVAVEHISVKNVNFYGTTNGARIKTWQEGKGYVRHVEFSSLTFKDVENPIIIDQYYCQAKGACPKTNTGVHIDDVVYANATGTSKTEVAIRLNCSNNVPCTNIVLDSVRLTYYHKNSQEYKAAALCNYAHGVAEGDVKPKSCLSP